MRLPHFRSHRRVRHRVRGPSPKCQDIGPSRPCGRIAANLSIDDICQKLNRTEVGRVWEAILCQLEEGEPSGPDVCSDRILMAGNSFGLVMSQVFGWHWNVSIPYVREQSKPNIPLMPVKSAKGDFYETHRHVPACARKRTSQTSLKFPTHAKVAELDDSGLGKQYIARFDIAMRNLLAVHVVEPFEHAFGQPGNHFFSNP
jgi:hypothetical protein